MSDFIDACRISQQIRDTRIANGFESLDLLKDLDGALTRDNLIKLCEEAYKTGYLRGYWDGGDKEKEKWIQ